MSMEYLLLESNDHHDMIAFVNKHIQEGWEPLGGISITLDRNTNFTREVAYVYCQAMIRKIKKTKKK